MELSDDEIADRLLLPPCRPSLIWGIPWEAFYGITFVWMCGLTLFGAIITGTGIGAIVWFGLRWLIAWDFNAISVIMVYGRTKLVAVRSLNWRTSVTLDPLYSR